MLKYKHNIIQNIIENSKKKTQTEKTKKETWNK